MFRKSSRKGIYCIFFVRGLNDPAFSDFTRMSIVSLIYISQENHSNSNAQMHTSTFSNINTRTPTLEHRYDTNGDGVISMQEFSKYLTSVFKVMYAAEPESAKRMGT